jgi:hypothetical protein
VNECDGLPAFYARGERVATRIVDIRRGAVAVCRIGATPLPVWLVAR